ncbi:MAG: ECF transporter S component [Erysipelotrichaceae bacterium]
MRNNSVRRLVIIALMIALSYILMFIGFPVVPIAPYLKVDFSFLPIVILALGLNLRSAILASFIVNMLDFFMKGSLTGLPIDQMANFLAITVFLLSMVYFERKGKRVLGLFVSVFINIAFMTLINYFWITPLYFSIAGWDMPENLLLYCVQVYGLFNLVKWGLVAAVYHFSTPYLNQFKQKVQQITR